MLTIEQIRRFFPAIEASPDVLLDNAGGSQVPSCVADAMRTYMLENYVQLGADYETSRRSTDTVARAHEFIELFMNGVGRGRVVLASSTTVLCAMLADCYARAAQNKRKEIIVAETSHEANAGPWCRLAERGFRVHVWPIELESLELRLRDLENLFSDRTLLVAFPHVSNVLGRIEDAKAFTEAAHAAGARVVIDGVAYAPHRAIDVADLEADWYVYSTYKVFGPHMAAMFGTNDAFGELDGPNHFFIPRHEVPYKFELGGPSHEGCAGLLGLWPYLAALTESHGPPHRAAIEEAFALISQFEDHLQTRLLEYLRSKPQVRVVGPSLPSPTRVPTVSFVHRKKRSADIAKAADAARFGIRYGHFYAYRLCARLVQEGLLHDVEDGVVRVSMLHYNSPQELEALIDCLDRLL